MSIGLMELSYTMFMENSTLRIRAVREDAAYTQGSVAKYLMCDQSLYSKYERGEREIPARYLAQLSILYKTSVDYLMYLTDERNPYPRR